MHCLSLFSMFIVPLALLFAARPSIVESSANVMVNERDPATFTCSANGSGELTIEWICSDGTNCGSSTNDEGADGRMTSTYKITSASASLNVTCVVNQSLASFMSEEADIEIRLPRTEPLTRTAKLTVILAPTIAITTTLPDSQQPGTSENTAYTAISCVSAFVIDTTVNLDFDTWH